MRKKQWIALSLGTAMVFSSSLIWASSNITLMVNGKEVNTDVAPTMESGVTFVPISFIAKELGATVDWKNPDVLITQGSDEIKCTVYNKEVFMNGERLELAAEPKLEWGRVLVPLRFVTEALGAKVDYDGEKGMINVTKEGEEITSQPQPEQDRDYSVFLDETSDTYIYTRDYLSETEILETDYFLYDTVSGKWGRLVDDGLSIYDNGDGQYPHVSSEGYLDLRNRKLFKGLEYKETPNRKWHYIEKREWLSSTGKDEIGFVRDVETGIVKEAFRSKSSPTVYSLPDSTFFIEISVPRAEDSQSIYPDDLFIYNPVNDEMTHIATGHRSYYISNKGIIMYDKNDKSYEYNLTTKQTRAITEAEYQINFDLYYSERDKINSEKAPILPVKEEREKFPEIKLETVPNYVGKVSINGKTEQLAFMFQRDHQIYVPVRSIINLTGLQVNKKDETIKEAVLGDKSITLDRNNSAIFDERLYVSETVLEELGMKANIEFMAPKD